MNGTLSAVSLSKQESSGRYPTRGSVSKETFKAPPKKAGLHNHQNESTSKANGRGNMTGLDILNGLSDNVSIFLVLNLFYNKFRF